MCPGSPRPGWRAPLCGHACSALPARRCSSVVEHLGDQEAEGSIPFSDTTTSSLGRALDCYSNGTWFESKVKWPQKPNERRKPAASPPCPRLRPKARQALRALCARADTARSQSLSPRSRRGGPPSGGTPRPQPDAGGGVAGLKPSPAILMRGTPPATFMPKLKCTRQRRLRMAQMTCKEKAGAKIKCRGNRCTHGF